MVIWITGISAAGKTTIGKAVFRELKHQYENLVFLDGDDFRRVLGNDIGFTLEERDLNARRLIAFCKLLSAQGLHIVCAANLTSQQFRDQCRRELEGYFEVFLDVPMEILQKRETKGLYAAAVAGKAQHIVGVDIEFIRPKSPDLVIDNSKDRDRFDSIVHEIIEKAGFG